MFCFYITITLRYNNRNLSFSNTRDDQLKSIPYSYIIIIIIIIFMIYTHNALFAANILRRTVAKQKYIVWLRNLRENSLNKILKQHWWKL